MMTPDEVRWHQDKNQYGWVLPPRAAWPFRIWGIRHIRAVLHNALAIDTAQQWAKIGLGVGEINLYDRWVIYAISRGWC